MAKLKYILKKILLLKLIPRFVQLASKKTITVHLSGDLGSQLFQWATARTLADKYGPSTEIYFDTSDFTFFKFFNPQLEQLGIPYRKRPENDQYYINLIDEKSKVYGGLAFLRLFRPRLQIETDPRIVKTFSSSRNLELKGFWRNIEYFEKTKISLLDSIQLPSTTLTSSSPAALPYKDQPCLLLPNQICVSEIEVQNWIQRAKNLIDPSQKLVLIKFIKSDFQYADRVVDISDFSSAEQLKFVSQLQHIFLTPNFTAWWSAWLYHTDNSVSIPTDWYGSDLARVEMLRAQAWRLY